MKIELLFVMALATALTSGAAQAFELSTFQKFACLKNNSWSEGTVSSFDLVKESKGAGYQAIAKKVYNPRGTDRVEQQILATGLICLNDEQDKRMIQCSSKSGDQFSTSLRFDNEAYNHALVISARLVSSTVDRMTASEAEKLGLEHEVNGARNAAWQIYLYHQPKPRRGATTQTDTCWIE